MQLIQGHFYGTGSALYLQLGGIPESFQMMDLDAATPGTVEWWWSMTHDILTCEGVYRPATGGAVEDLAFGEGIAPYYGGDLLTTSNQTSTAYGSAVYFEPDTKDYRYYTVAAAGISGDAATTDITTWTLDTAATPSGHFNGDVTGTYIGPGSTIWIADSQRKHTYRSTIMALTAGQGVSSDEVTLSSAVPSGNVVKIESLYGYKPSAVGITTKAGVKINHTTVAASSHMIAFRAFMGS